MNTTSPTPRSTTLSTKYADAVARRVPEDSREDIREEVTGIISEMIEVRTSDIQDAPAAGHAAGLADVERHVLTELGDPADLARRFNGRQQYLIGPGAYPVYVRLLSWLLPVVGVVALFLNAALHFATVDDPHLGAAIATGVAGTVVPLLIAFSAITLLVAFLERVMPSGEMATWFRTTGEPWSVDDLADERGNQAPHRVEALINIVLLAVFATFPLWTTSVFYVGDLNDGGTFVNPDLGTGWLVGYWALLVAVAATEVWRFAQDHPAIGPAIANAVVDVLFAGFLTVLALTQDVLDPEIASSDGVTWIHWIVIIGLWAIVMWDQVVTFKNLRDQRNVGEV